MGAQQGHRAGDELSGDTINFSFSANTDRDSDDGDKTFREHSQDGMQAHETACKLIKIHASI